MLSSMNDPVMTIDVHDRLASVKLRYRPAGGGDAVESTLARAAAVDLVAARPVREFRWYKGRRFYSGWYWAATTCSLIAYESLLELARILLADFDPGVSAISAQPFHFCEESAAATHRHVPDLLLGHHDGRISVVDVKPAHRLADPAVRAVFEWTAELVALRGWDFEVWSGADPVALANVRFLAGYRRAFTVDTSLCPALLELAEGQATLGGIERAARSLGEPYLVRPALLHLLWTHRLETDLSAALAAGSLIWRAER